MAEPSSKKQKTDEQAMLEKAIKEYEEASTQLQSALAGQSRDQLMIGFLQSKMQNAQADKQLLLRRQLQPEAQPLTKRV